jgi:hypothetical protein
MSLICPRAKCKQQEGPCTCEKILAVVVGAAIFFGLYFAILNQG